jgi:SAM-dependent methyltransferase
MAHLMDGSEGQVQFTAVAEWYDALMADVPYDTWMRYVTGLVVRHASRPSRMIPCRVLDLACGTGSMSFRFEEAGCSVVGVDIAEAMVAVARRKAAERRSACTFLVQDAASLDVAAGSFDLCVSLFDSMNYVVEPDALKAAFGSVGRALAPGGLFIFDLNTPYALRDGFFDQEDLGPDVPVAYRWRSAFDERTRLCTVTMDFFPDARAADPPTHSARQVCSASRFTEIHVQRAYDNHEISRLLDECGLEVRAVYHAYTFDPCAAMTDRAYFVARAPESVT